MFSRKSTGNVVLVMDVDDASVGVSIVEYGTSATIRAGARARVTLDTRTDNQIVAALTEIAGTTIAQVLASHTAAPGAKPVDAIFLILHSPWTSTRTASVGEEYEHPIVITKQRIAALAEKALPANTTSSVVLETGVIHTALNGYPTAVPLGKHASQMHITVQECSAEGAIKSGMESAILAHIPGRSITVASGFMTVRTVLAEQSSLQKYLYVHVGDRSTTFYTTGADGSTLATAAPEGLLTILTRLSSGGLPEETLSQLRMLSRGACTDDVCRALSDSLARAEPDLAKVYGEALTQLVETRRIPNETILSAPFEIASWLQTFFTRIDFSQFTTTTQPLEVRLLDAELVKNIVWGSIVPDTSLGVSIRYVHILEESHK